MLLNTEQQQPLTGRRRELAPYLRLLWASDRPLLPTTSVDEVAPFISDLGIHLPEPPASAPAAWHRAAAAHAAAHLAHPRPRLPWASRTAITRVLIGLLEDARVEALAMRELPGLRRLWLPFHTAGPDLGPGFAPLLARLDRALIDPAYGDPHPWIVKGRRLFAEIGGADAEHGALARAASHLGNDIGQMRLQFNDREHVVSPAYRDDNRWLWEPESEDEIALGSDAAPGEPDDGTFPTAPADAVNGTGTAVHPEWDYVIRRTRPAWCTVHERMAPAGTTVVPQGEALVPRLAQALRQRAPTARIRRPREAAGDEFDAAGLVDVGLSRRLRRPIDDRIRIRTVTTRPPLAILLLIDISASTAEALDRSDSVLARAQRSAAAIATACATASCACAVHAFRSNGRHEIDYLRVAEAGDPWDAAAAARLAGLRSGGSTRLGPALRHAASLLEERSAGDRLILVLTDGQPHDVDVHDPRYLTEDARHAVEQARRAGLRVGALGLSAECAPALRRLFGNRAWSLLPRLEALPTALSRILAGTA